MYIYIINNIKIMKYLAIVLFVITVSSCANQGKNLWEKTNQLPEASSPIEKIVTESNPRWDSNIQQEQAEIMAPPSEEEINAAEEGIKQSEAEETKRKQEEEAQRYKEETEAEAEQPEDVITESE